MSGAGPDAPPAPAMTSPGLASTWISLKVKVGGDSEAGGGADVAAHSGPFEEQPMT